MGSFSVWHWMIVMLPFLPFFWVLKKMGRSPLWGILGMLPIANVVIFWVAAFWRWPALEVAAADLDEFD